MTCYIRYTRYGGNNRRINEDNDYLKRIGGRKVEQRSVNFNEERTRNFRLTRSQYDYG